MKKKNKKKKYAAITIIGITVVILALTLIFYLPTEQIMISFKNQCSLNSCPSGYTDTGTICDNLQLECIRTCMKEVGGHCGTFGSEQAVGDIYTMTAETNKDSYWNSPYGPIESTTKCYKYRTGTVFTVTNRDPCGYWDPESKSHEVYTKDYTYKTQSNMAYSTSNSISVGSLWSVGKLGDGTKNKALGRQIPYKGTVPRAGDDACGSEGELSIYLFYKVAPWVKDYDYKTITCSYECNSDSDCGSKQISGSPYCEGNKIVQEYNVPECNDYTCDYDNTIVETIKICGSSENCENGICIYIEPDDIIGCMDLNALNYNSDATIPSYDCEYSNGNGDISPAQCITKEDCKDLAKVICDDKSLWYHDYYCSQGECVISEDIPPESCISDGEDDKLKISTPIIILGLSIIVVIIIFIFWIIKRRPRRPYYPQPRRKNH